MRFLVFIIWLVLSPTLIAKQIEVCSTCPVRSIAQGIALSASHDTLIIKSGTYLEHGLQVKTPITIIGINLPVIDGEGKAIMEVNADSVHIEGLKFQNVSTSYTSDLAALKLYRSHHFTLQNLILENTFFGLLLEKSKNGTVNECHVTGNAINEYNSGNGIHLWHTDSITIKNSSVHQMRDGIYLEFVTNSEIHNNFTSKNLRYGLHFMFSNHNTFYNNEFTQNGAGVAVMFSKFVTLHHNKFNSNWGSASYGLLLKEIYDAEIYENTFFENTIGINAEGSTRINYNHNNFKQNGWAVKITGACYQNIFNQNNFISNAFDVSYQGRINENKFSANYWSEYNGYDIDKNGIGDIPYRPVKLFSYIVNNTPESILLLRSLFIDIINFSEKVSPIFTPDNLVDESPQMAPYL